ncbi:MAG: dihydropteroate synthase [Candidatus Omnitrophota bacterium]|nr:dihydropteroate synthase [Candidatus Omnitrophota bacterium]
MTVRIISLRDQSEAKALMRDLGVETAGIEIMAPKTIPALVRINNLPIFAANILKQESLSIGADTAVSRDALTGKKKHTDCLIIGNLTHIQRLSEKLKRQPYGLNKIALELQAAFNNYQKDNFTLALKNHQLNLASQTRIMGIINLTPDSFSGDGLLETLGSAVEYARKLADEGADMLDIGAESTRPGAKPVSAKDEIKRLIPALKRIRKEINLPISIDTYKAETAKAALDSGADIINDISALTADKKMAKTISRYKAGVVLMHMRGIPKNMQKNPAYQSLMGEIIEYLNKSIAIALEAGIDFEKIIVDPGIGFGKTLEHNLEIIKSLAQLKILGRPILIGLSRKSFLWNITHQGPKERLSSTISSNCLAVFNGAKIIRVHDVKESKQAFMVLDRILKCPSQ